MEPASTLRLALAVSSTEEASAAADILHARYAFTELGQADAVVALGGDGFMLQTLHQMLDDGVVRPVFGMNLGTVGFLMNEWRPEDLPARVAAAARDVIHPLRTTITTVAGSTHTLPAINELSLLRETRQIAKMEVIINGQPMMDELACDGVLVATPAGSTAYNLSANGPILPLESAMLALTPISPFRPRRWRGAILPDTSVIQFRVRETPKRPVSAVADQREIRNVAEVTVELDRSRPLTLMFDPDSGLDDRIALEQFIV